MARILIVDDEEALREGLRFNLEIEGFEVDTVDSAERALGMQPAAYDLILLDVMMGAMSGFKFAQRLKKEPSTAHVPIIFLTARDGDDDMVAGLTIGADDYISKPFTVRNVVARVRAVLRRTAKTADNETLAYQGLKIDRKSMRCTIDGQELAMPRKELEILSLMLSDPGRIFSRAEIMSRVWPDGVVVSDRTIDVNITRLRQKLGAYGAHIVTRPAYGYGFEF